MTSELSRKEIDRLVKSNLELADLGHIHQVALFHPTLTRHTDLQDSDYRFPAKKFRRSENIRVYPDKLGKIQSVTYVVAWRQQSGLEIELVRPLIEPSYIDRLGIKPMGIAHLAVNAPKSVGDLAAAEKVFKKDLAGMVQVQTGTVRWDKSSYSIWNVDPTFAPIKIVRKSKESK